jgi:hypothetical protein
MAAAAVVAAVGVAGCGGSDKEEGAQIPRADAAALINRLQEAERRSDPFRCNDLRKDTLPALEREVQALPDNVDADVRSTVEDGVAHLSELVDQQCESDKQDTKTDTTPTTPTETEPAPTQTQTQPTPTQTQPPKTTPTPTTPTPTPTTPGNGGAEPGAGKPNKGKETAATE